MLRLVFETDTIQYGLPGDTEIFGDPLPASPYHSDLVTPPRIYAEQLVSSGYAMGLYLHDYQTRWGTIVITMIMFTDQIYWPSWNWFAFHWDATSGDFLGRDVMFNWLSNLRFFAPETGDYGDAVSYYLGEVVLGRDGSGWAHYQNQGQFRQIDPTLFSIVGPTRTASEFGETSFSTIAVDPQADLLLAATSLSAHLLKVYDLTTGELLRSVELSASVACIALEDTSRCYIYTTDNMVNLVNYQTGRVLNSFRAPVDFDTASRTKMAWDPYHRRLLFFYKTPEATDGACTSTVKGYYPVPVATYLQKPIPLVPPRAGRTIPVMSRLVGDSGEAVSGGVISATVSSGGALVGPPGITDSAGYCLMMVECDEEATLTVDLSTTVAD